MTQTITISQAIESMVEHVRANLQLQDRKESESGRVITFMGMGISREASDLPFALEVVTKTDRALPVNHFNARLKLRASSSEGTFTGIMLPRSIDYHTATAEMQTPYLNQARLLPEWVGQEIRAMYSRFNRYDVKDLSRIEWQLALPLSGYRLAYYNPLQENVEVLAIMRFRRNEIIPDNRPREEAAKDQHYFWDFVEANRFPLKSDTSRKAQVFRGIQRGLHDRVRMITGTEKIKGNFTLTRYHSDELDRLGLNGSRVVRYP